MNVLVLTIFVSMMLAAFFVGAFLYHHDYSGGDAMRDSLLPFKKEKLSAEKRRQQSSRQAGRDIADDPQTNNRFPNNS